MSTRKQKITRSYYFRKECLTPGSIWYRFYGEHIVAAMLILDKPSEASVRFIWIHADKPASAPPIECRWIRQLDPRFWIHVENVQEYLDEFKSSKKS